MESSPCPSEGEKKKRGQSEDEERKNVKGGWGQESGDVSPPEKVEGVLSGLSNENESRVFRFMFSISPFWVISLTSTEKGMETENLFEEKEHSTFAFMLLDLLDEVDDHRKEIFARDVSGF